MNIDEALNSILEEYDRASTAIPSWPIDPIHAASVVTEEAGELLQAANDSYYPAHNHNGPTYERMRKEAIQTAAMALRFLVGLEHYISKNNNRRHDV